MESVIAFPGSVKASLAEAGGKGLSLINGSAAGLPVPPGLVLTVEFFRPWLEQLRQSDAWTHFSKASESELQAACNALKSETVRLSFDQEQQRVVSESLKKYPDDALFAVRSSSPEEDLDGASFAGGYETILGVNKQHLESAVRTAFASCLDYRVALYKREHGFDMYSPKIAVVIQKQIASDVAGVAFSINPLTNNFDEAVINANFGLGETVVAGLATPDTFAVNRGTRQVTLRECGGKETSIWLKPDGGTEERPAVDRNKLSMSDEQVLQLADLINRVEQIYSKPIDTEWAFEQGQLYLLQARPITAFVPVAPEMLTAPGEKKLLYVDMTIVVQGLYKPMTVMGTDVIRTLIATSSTHIMGASILGEPRSSVLICDNGRIFANASNIMGIVGKDGFSKFIGNVDPVSSKALAEADDSYVTQRDGHPHPPFHLLLQLPEIAAHLLEARILPEHVHKTAQRDINKFLSEMRELGSRNVRADEIADELLERTFKFIFKTSAPLFAVSRLALQRLKGLLTPEDEAELARIERALPNNITTEMGLDLYHLSRLERNSKQFDEEWRRFIYLYGHRGPVEFDIASPRYRDEPKLLLDQIETLRTSANSEDNPQTRFEKAQVERHEAFETLCERVHKRSGWIQYKRFQSLYKVYETLAGYREVHKYLLIFALDQLRTMLLKDAQQLVAQGKLKSPEEIFDLTMADLRKAWSNPAYDLQEAIKRNSAFPKKLAAAPGLPCVFDSRGKILRPPPAPLKEGEIAGTAISPGISRGRIKVLHAPDEKPLLRGEILVARATDPGWTPLFVNASAVILEVGGMLQHGALVAREYGLPCVSGVPNVTTLWPDGTLVEVDGDAGIIRLLEEA